MKANAGGGGGGAVTVAAALVVIAALLTAGAEGAVTCSPIQLSPCAAAITSASAPSAVCCQRIQQQKACLCGYMRNPTLKKFVDTPNARKVASRCRTPFPKC